MKLRYLTLLGLSCLLLSCSGSVTATYDPTTSKVTATGTVSGKSKELEVTGNGPGVITITDPDCGTIKINVTCEGPTTVKIKCGDPILAEIPDAWTYLGGAYETSLGGIGAMLLSDAAAYVDPVRGPIVTDTGYKAVVLEADQLFPGGETLVYTLGFDTAAINAEGTVLKAVEVATVTFEQGGVQCAPPALAVPEDELVPNFPNIDDPNRLTVVTRGDVPAVSDWGLVVMALLVLTTGTLVYARRRATPA